MNDEIYGDERAGRLVELLRTLAARIEALRSDGDLLAAGPELMKLMGDARSELFHYEVRVTYDTPQQVESRRVVDEARRSIQFLDLTAGYDPEGDGPGDGPWAT